MVRKKLTYKAAIVAAAMIFFFLLLGVGAQIARADASAYTNVLDDLRADESFTAADYSVNYKDNSIKVIQIAESTDGELFIYTYQPTGQYRDLKASSINIARKPDNSLNLKFENYALTFLNSAGVFFKYKVENFEIETTPIRYYNISNILRPFEYLLDTVPDVGSISEVPYAVGQLWTVYEESKGNVRYGMAASEVIEITKKYVGFVDLFDGVDLNGTTITGTHTMRNFVAFSTDKPIDRLIQVELQYSLSDCSSEICCNGLCTYHGLKEVYNRERGEAVPQKPVTISADEKDSNIQHGGILGNWAGNSYTWKKIQTTADFLAEESNKDYKLTNSDGVKDITGTQWVLNFYKDVQIGTGSVLPWEGHLKWTYKSVTDVIILRLMFETDGETYSLGVVDSKMTGDDKPLNSYEKEPIPWWVWAIVGVVGFIVLLIIVYIFCPPLWRCFKAICIGIGKVIAAPFRAISNRRKANAAAATNNINVRDEKRELKMQAKLDSYQNDLERKEKNRQRKLDIKETKQEEKNRAKSKNKRKDGKKAQRANKSVKGKGKKK